MLQSARPLMMILKASLPARKPQMAKRPTPVRSTPMSSRTCLTWATLTTCSNPWTSRPSLPRGRRHRPLRSRSLRQPRLPPRRRTILTVCWMTCSAPAIRSLLPGRHHSPPPSLRLPSRTLTRIWTISFHLLTRIPNPRHRLLRSQPRQKNRNRLPGRSISMPSSMAFWPKWMPNRQRRPNLRRLRPLPPRQKMHFRCRRILTVCWMNRSPPKPYRPRICRICPNPGHRNQWWRHRTCHMLLPCRLCPRSSSPASAAM